MYDDGYLLRHGIICTIIVRKIDGKKDEDNWENYLLKEMISKTESSSHTELKRIKVTENNVQSIEDLKRLKK